METVVSARINTVQPNDHSLENTTIKNSARVSSSEKDTFLHVRLQKLKSFWWRSRGERREGIAWG